MSQTKHLEDKFWELGNTSPEKVSREPKGQGGQGWKLDSFGCSYLLVVAGYKYLCWGQIPFPFYRKSISKMQTCRRN